MSDTAPIILWFRRDLRLSDNPMLAAAAATGRPLVPAVILDDQAEAMGAAPRFRLGLGLEAFGQALAEAGSRLILRRGDAKATLQRLIEDTGATAVWWGRQYTGPARARDTAVKSALRDRGIEARSFPGHLLFEPWTVEKNDGGVYKVYTPYWRAVRGRDPGAPCRAPSKLHAPDNWPESDRLQDWRLDAGLDRGAAVVQLHTCVGEHEAALRLRRFIDSRVAAYKDRRDIPAADATSRLSENLTWGEIGPRTVWAAGQRALEEGAPGAETFLQELVWREFAWHLFYHHPDMERANWRSDWDGFGWDDDADSDAVLRWKQGRTGVELVDAAMRELYVTGTMHNRARMITASYLTKHLLVHWRVGLEWFAECLIDWDPASNAMGWQWVAGSGPDAAPYFRVFNPDLQAKRFDPDRAYRDRFLAEGRKRPAAEALAFFDAIPRSWGLRPDARPPGPLIDLARGRKRALAAYDAHKASA